MTTTNEELARLREAFAAPAEPPEPSAPEDCPPPDRIWMAVRGELPPEELREILDHVAACSACAEDWRIAMAFEEEARAVAPDSRRAAARSGTVRHRAWMAVAATILVAVVGFQLRPRTDAPPPTYRSGGGQAVESLLPENASLPRQRFVLSWKSVPGAASYNVTVSRSATLTTLYEAKGVTATTVTVPESALTGLPSGTRILWLVTPVARDGGQMQDRTFHASVVDRPQ